jgi:DNA-directed RNA polymerase subunit E'/Rpb7
MTHRLNTIKASQIMFSLHTHCDTIELKCSSLHRNWRVELLKNLKRLKNRTVSIEDGAILSVEKILSTNDPVCKHGKTLCRVTYDALSFIPFIGEVYYGYITLIIQLGLIIESQKMVKVLIRHNKIPPGYKFIDSNKTFSNGVHSYAVGDQVKFKVVNLQYKPMEINCIASLEQDLTIEVIDTIIEPEDTFVDR